MKFHVKCRIFLGLFFFVQPSQTRGKTPEELALFMQKNVEHLIEKILTQVQEYYHEIKSDEKCIPDFIPESLIETLKKSIDCISQNERNYANGKIKHKTYTKNFLRCFSTAKKEVNETMTAIDLYQNYCPQNMTEKAYEINVTTTFIKAFQINIKNGLEVTHKEIDFGKGNCLNHISDIFDDNSSNYGHASSNVNDYDYENEQDGHIKHNNNNKKKHKIGSNNKTKHNDEQDGDYEENGNNLEEDTTDEYSLDYYSTDEGQENFFDDYDDKDAFLDSNENFQSNDTSKSLESNSKNIKNSKPEIKNNNINDSKSGVK